MEPKTLADYLPRKSRLGLTLGGLLGVPVAAFLVKSLPLTAVRWLVMIIVLYAAQAMLRSALSKTELVLQGEQI